MSADAPERPEVPAGLEGGLGGAGRALALVAAVVIALSLTLAARVRRPTLPADGAVAAAEGDAGEVEPSAEASVAATASALPGPKDPVAPAAAAATWRVSALKEDATVTYVEAPVGKRTLSGALARAGLPTHEIHRLLKAFDGKRKLDRARPKDTFAFALDKAKGRLLGFELATAASDVWQARPSDGADGPGSGPLVVSKLDLAVERRKIAAAFSVETELHDAVRKAGLDEDILKRLDDALDGHFELAAMRAGTRVRLVATEVRVEGALTRYAHVDAVDVHPPSGPALRVYRFAGDDDDDGHEGRDGREGKGRRRRRRPPGFYDGKGHQPYHGGWRSPVPGARISSRFNPKRMHPVLHVVMPHNGIDFASPTGAKVYAASGGTVVTAGNGGPCGNMVQIEHPGGLTTSYCHLSRFAAGLHAGQHVDTRQLVGYVGATGRVTGPHLHFALKKAGQFVDPMSLKMDGVRVLPPSERGAFAAVRARLDGDLDAVSLPAATAAADAGARDEEVFEEAPDEGADAGAAGGDGAP
ncbi:MAG TPA: M23 family metallopeptidase [Polyangiaceae bacterium]|nr:M23 family metallopeptidase [Polyangiaceae bacterium]